MSSHFAHRARCCVVAPFVVIMSAAVAAPVPGPGIAPPLLDADAAALPAVTGEHYEGGHWLGTFAIYLLSERGLR